MKLGVRQAQLLRHLSAVKVIDAGELDMYPFRSSAVAGRVLDSLWRAGLVEPVTDGPPRHFAITEAGMRLALTPGGLEPHARGRYQRHLDPT
jgi:hypothetical protein